MHKTVLLKGCLTPPPHSTEEHASCGILAPLPAHGVPAFISRRLFAIRDERDRIRTRVGGVLQVEWECNAFAAEHA